MKLTAKLEVIPLPTQKIGRRQAEKVFSQALDESEAFLRHLRAFKADYINCCFDFYIARGGFTQGEWEAHCALFADKISIRTIQRRIEEADFLIRWAMYNNKALGTLEEIRLALLGLPLASVRGAVQEMRENEIARPFGEYFGDDYLQKKQKALNGQEEFNFEEFGENLARLCSSKTALPAELEKLVALEGTLQSAASRVRHEIRTLKSK